MRRITLAIVWLCVGCSGPAPLPPLWDAGPPMDGPAVCLDGVGCPPGTRCVLSGILGTCVGDDAGEDAGTEDAGGPEDASPMADSWREDDSGAPEDAAPWDAPPPPPDAYTAPLDAGDGGLPPCRGGEVGPVCRCLVGGVCAPGVTCCSPIPEAGAGTAQQCNIRPDLCAS